MSSSFRPVLLSVWCEVGKHLEIAESVQRIALLLRPQLPADLVLVRAIDRERSCLETVGLGSSRGTTALPPSRTELDRDAMERLLTWCREGAVSRHRGGHAVDDDFPLLPAGLRGDLLAGPLVGADGPVGVVLFFARRTGAFERAHEPMARSLLDPLAAAFENDRRVHEIVRLREAAEADRRTLLTRLGRQEVTEPIIGAEGGLRPVMERVQLVARSDVPVLLFGETGSGKEVVARTIHVGSRRATAPFLRVNCGAIPTELIDSELFGHERGSFTGAVGNRQGWFERADGGTLFLDEVGELPPAAQVRLLRILQDGTFERVGGGKQLSADVRIVAATHRDLEGMVRSGQFREDLWYRIAVFPIRLPALREHPEDIPALATHFALRACARFGMPALAPSVEDIGRLIAYRWPGNVRELKSVMERAAILGDGERLQVALALGAPPSVSVTPAEAGIHSVAAAPHPRTDRIVTLDEAMARHIELALAAAGGTIEGPRGAARRLGINPHTLRARMRKLKIDWGRYRNVQPFPTGLPQSSSSR